MTAWMLTGAGLVAAVLTVAAYRLALRGFRRGTGPDHDQGILCYLHEKHVMIRYWQDNYEALTQEVEERTRVDTEVDVGAQIGRLRGRAGRESERERISKYIRDVGPITVIGRIVEELQRKGNIVHVDLFAGSIEPGTGLDRALRVSHRDPAPRRSVPLSELSGSFLFVSVVGPFEVTGRTDETTTLSAPYGDASGYRLSVTCENSQLLAEVPAGRFSARCLGRVQRWDPDNRELVLEPVLAVFR